MKITFSVDEELILKAHERAAAERTTLNKEFGRWLEKYAEHSRTTDTFTELMELLDYVQPGHLFHRDEMGR